LLLPFEFDLPCLFVFVIRVFTRIIYIVAPYTDNFDWRCDLDNFESASANKIIWFTFKNFCLQKHGLKFYEGTIAELEEFSTFHQCIVCILKPDDSEKTIELQTLLENTEFVQVIRQRKVLCYKLDQTCCCCVRKAHTKNFHTLPSPSITFHTPSLEFLARVEANETLASLISTCLYALDCFENNTL